MADRPDRIGIIAGNGAYPFVFARAARAAGVEFLAAAAFTGETEPGLQEEVDRFQWLRVGQLGKLIKFFKDAGVAHAVMAGQIAPRNLFDLRPDLRALVLIGKLKRRNAESIFGAIGDELEREGVALLPATTFLEDLLPGPGHVGGPKPGKRARADAAFGFAIAKEVSRMDIGQTVVVKSGTVLAVEALEGTNAAIARGGRLGKGGATVVKVSKPSQDFRFDVPVVGPRTVAAAAQAGIATIAVEAGRTLLLERDAVDELCEKHGISLVALGEQDEEPTDRT